MVKADLMTALMDKEKLTAYTGQNPKTGEKLAVQQRETPFFRVGKELKQRVDK